VGVVKLLLDTHALLWWWGEPELLSDRARSLIAQHDHDVWVSAATAWEIATKVRLGKLRGAAAAVPHYLEWLKEDGFASLPIAPEHALKAGALAADHRDPFDRMLAAQALMEGFTVVTRDPALSALGAATAW
jgi:PIN domain nuclease of toxin-antitoxin system